MAKVRRSICFEEMLYEELEKKSDDHLKVTSALPQCTRNQGYPGSQLPCDFHAERCFCTDYRCEFLDCEASGFIVFGPTAQYHFCFIHIRSVCVWGSHELR